MRSPPLRPAPARPRTYGRLRRERLLQRLGAVRSLMSSAVSRQRSSPVVEGSRSARRGSPPRRGRGCRAGSWCVVHRPHLADEVLHLELGPRSSPVVGSSSRSSTGEVRSARARATFCCVPRERFSIACVRRETGKPTRRGSCGIRSLVSFGCQPVEPGGVRQVLGGRHLLEERGSTETRLDQRADARSRGSCRKMRACRRPAGAASRAAGPASTSPSRSGPETDASSRSISNVIPRKAATRVRLRRPSDELLAQVVDFYGVMCCSSASRRHGQRDPANGGGGETCQLKSNIERRGYQTSRRGANAAKPGPTGAVWMCSLHRAAASLVRPTPCLAGGGTIV
jgi:hypothetical protein